MESVEKILRYSFANKSLLKDALTPTSRNKSTSFPRLQFLGGAALALAFTNHLYLAYPNLEPCELSQLRSANLSHEKFGLAVVNHGLHQFLIGYNPSSELAAKVKQFSEAKGKEDDPVLYGGIVKPPKIIADLVESIAGAVYIDVDFDVKKLWEICRGLFEPIYTLDDLRRQPQLLATLFRLADKLGKRVDFRYCEGPKDKLTIAEVYLDDMFLARGLSRMSRDLAKLSAAKVALRVLSESMPIEMVMGEDSLDIEIEDAKEKLIEICNKRKWPDPIYSVETPRKGFVCSVTIETPTEEGTLCIKGYRRSRRKLAENSTASHMLRALRFSLKDDLQS